MFRFTSFESTIHILLVSALLIAALLVPKPVSAQDIVPNPAAEAYLLDELRFGGYADLQNFSENEEERGVSGAALLKILADPAVQENSSIYIVNATITDSLSAIDLISSADLVFHQVEFAGDAYFGSSKLEGFEAYNSTFVGDLMLSSSSINGQVNLVNNTFNGIVDFGTSVLASYTNITSNTFQNSLTFLRATLNANVDLRDNIIHESLNFYGAHVVGELLLDGTQILGTEAMPGTSYPVEFWSTRVDGPASFLNTVFAGSVYFAQSNFSKLNMFGASFNGDVSFTGTIVEHSADFTSAKFSGIADFSDVQIGRDLIFEGATFNVDANFRSTSVARDANFSGATFYGGADFYYFEADRYVDFVSVTSAEGIWFQYATIGYLYFQETIFNGTVSFFGMRIGQALEFVNCTYNYTGEAFPVTNVNVVGNVNFSEFTAPAGLYLSNNHFGDLTISTKDNPNLESIDVTASEIDGSLSIENVTMKSFRAAGASIEETTSLINVSITKDLDLRNANIGFLKMDENLKWPNDHKAFNLRGMTYSDIDVGDQDLTEITFQGLLRFVNESAYSPQAYQALSQFLTDKGHPDWAAKVNLAQKRRERNEILTPFSGAWLWSWFLDIFAGYGYIPALAFIWSGIVVAFGAFVFRHKENMLPVEQDDVHLVFSPAWYSFSLFLPYIDLGIASKWEPTPEKKWLRNYKYIHMMLGWVLAPIALLAFGGVFG